MVPELHEMMSIVHCFVRRSLGERGDVLDLFKHFGGWEISDIIEKFSRRNSARGKLHVMLSRPKLSFGSI